MRDRRLLVATDPLSDVTSGHEPSRPSQFHRSTPRRVRRTGGKGLHVRGLMVLRSMSRRTVGSLQPRNSLQRRQLALVANSATIWHWTDACFQQVYGAPEWASPNQTNFAVDRKSVV